MDDDDASEDPLDQISDAGLDVSDDGAVISEDDVTLLQPPT